MAADGGASDERPVVLVIGAARDVGRFVARALADDYRVVGMDAAGEEAEIDVDLTLDASVDHALGTLRDRYGGSLASVVHLAACQNPSRQGGTFDPTLDAGGTRRLLDRLQRFRVERFVLASTMLVERGTGPGGTIDEDAPLDPRSAFAESMAAAEAVTREHHGAIPYAILRLAGLYDDDSVGPALADQIARIRERRPESHFHAGNLDTRRATIHRDDLAAAIRLVFARRAMLPPDTVLLLGEPDPPTYRTVQEAVGEMLHGEPWRTLRVPAPVAAAGAWLGEKLLPHLPAALGGTERPLRTEATSDSYVLDIGRARTMIGWEPRRRLMATLPTILHSLKLDPEGWYERNGLEWPG